MIKFANEALQLSFGRRRDKTTLWTIFSDFCFLFDQKLCHFCVE